MKSAQLFNGPHETDSSRVDGGPHDSESGVSGDHEMDQFPGKLPAEQQIQRHKLMQANDHPEHCLI